MNWVNLIGGLLSLFLGCGFIYYIIKHPFSSEEDYTRANQKGVLAGVTFIIGGIIFLYKYFHS